MRHVARAEPAIGQQRYERILDGSFVLLHSAYQHPDVPDSLAVLDDTACHYFDVRGVRRVFDVQLTESGLSMVRRDPDFWQRSFLRVLGPDAMDGTGENSHDDGASWEHNYSVSYSRIG